MEEKYLPIGTICKLKGGTNPLMIIGFCMKKSMDDDEINDYAGCPYPTGVISSEINFLFNHNQIEEIIHKGYENDLEKEFKKQLKEHIEKLGIKSVGEKQENNINQQTNVQAEIINRLPNGPMLNDLKSRFEQDNTN